jgi:hypothetical protein
MKRRINKIENKAEEESKEEEVKEEEINNKTELTQSISKSSTPLPASSKIIFNLKWKTGSFECNLLNAHTKLVEENGQFKLEVNLN